LLWGKDGDAWTPASRLPDFSFAGYHSGEKPIPDVPVFTSVTAHGARGDGIADDTQAFRTAIAATETGAILIPAGRYLITDQLKITKSGVVLRGEGIGKTVLVIPKSLEQLLGSEFEGVKNPWAFKDAFIEFIGIAKMAVGEKLARVVQPAKRGESRLVLDTVVGIEPGMWVRLLMGNDPALGRHVHADLQDSSPVTGTELKYYCDRVARVTAVKNSVIELDRPFRLDVRPEWQAEVYAWKTPVEESGIESLSIEFPGVPKRKHLTEEGFNAISLTGVANCWVRHVEVLDGDLGIMVGRTRFSTIADVSFSAPKRSASQGNTGHHGIWVSGKSQDCLVTGFHFNTTYEHDVTVESVANGNVFERGDGVAINLDHHARAPYENLFTDIMIGDPKRLWASGGSPERRPHAGARTTLWNLRTTHQVQPPAVPNWAQINVIGLPGYRTQTTSDGVWIEPCAGGVTPANLYRAQLARRLKIAADK